MSTKTRSTVVQTVPILRARATDLHPTHAAGVTATEHATLRRRVSSSAESDARVVLWTVNRID